MMTREGVKSTFIGVRVDPKLKRDVQRVAKKLDRPASWVITRFIAEGLKREADKAGAPASA